MIDGTLGSSGLHQCGVRFGLDTGAGLDLIRRNVFPMGWKTEIDLTLCAPRFNYSNGNQMNLKEMVRMTTRFGNILFRMLFIIANQLAVEVILGTSLHNHHVD